METLRYEVWEDDNTGGRVAAFRYIDDARAFAGHSSALVYDTQQNEDATHYPLDPARMGGHDVRQQSNPMDFCEQCKVLEHAKRDIGTIITRLAHGEANAVLRGIAAVIESLTKVSDDFQELNT